MKTTSLRIEDGVVWLREETIEKGVFTVGMRLLGPACEERYHEVPAELWPQLEEAIEEEREAERFMDAVKAEQEETYRRQKL